MITAELLKMPWFVGYKKSESVLDYNRKVMDMLGLWPIGPRTSKGGRFWRSFSPVFNLCRLAVFIFLEVMSINLAWGDTYLTVESTIALILFIHTSVKFATLYSRRARVRLVMARVDQLNADLVAISHRNVAILQKTNTTSDLINKYTPMAIIISLAACVCVLVPYGYSKRQMAFMLWFPYDVKACPSFEITTVVVVIGFFIDVVTVLFCDLCVINLTLHLASQLHMLSCDILNAKQIVDENLKSRSRRRCNDFPQAVRMLEGNTRRMTIVSNINHHDWMDPYLGPLVERSDVIETGASGASESCPRAERWYMQRLASQRQEEMARRMMNELMSINVNHHQQIIILVNEIQSIFNVLLAEQIVLNCLLGLAGLYVSTLAEITDPKVILMTTIIMACLLEFFIICLGCDRLTIASMQVFDSAYESDWLEASESFKRSLRLLMTRAQKHLAIKAAGVPLSRRSFRSVCKGAYYFQSLLNKIYDKP